MYVSWSTQSFVFIIRLVRKSLLFDTTWHFFKLLELWFITRNYNNVNEIFSTSFLFDVRIYINSLYMYFGELSFPWFITFHEKLLFIFFAKTFLFFGRRRRQETKNEGFWNKYTQCLCSSTTLWKCRKVSLFDSTHKKLISHLTRKQIKL